MVATRRLAFFGAGSTTLNPHWLRRLRAANMGAAPTIVRQGGEDGPSPGTSDGLPTVQAGAGAGTGVGGEL